MDVTDVTGSGGEVSGVDAPEPGNLDEASVGRHDGVEAGQQRRRRDEGVAASSTEVPHEVQPRVEHAIVQRMDCAQLSNG